MGSKGEFSSFVEVNELNTPMSDWFKPNSNEFTSGRGALPKYSSTTLLFIRLQESNSVALEYDRYANTGNGGGFKHIEPLDHF